MSDPISSKNGPSPQEWEQGWEGHDLAQLRRLAKLSFPDRLDRGNVQVCPLDFSRMTLTAWQI